MMKSFWSLVPVLLAIACAEPPPVPPETAAGYEYEVSTPEGRALQLADYYRIPTPGSPRLSPDGQWVAFTISTRTEADNSTRVSSWVVPADGSREPVEVLVQGGAVVDPTWTPEGELRVRRDSSYWIVYPRMPRRGRLVGPPEEWLGAPDGGSRARLVDQPLEPPTAVAMTDFERRHQDRFQGRTFDWMYFQRDGQPFPVPDPRRRPARHVVIEGADGAEHTLVDLDLRPSTLRWSPDGSALAFIADAHFRDESTYQRPDLWLAPVEGELRRLTDDGYTYSGLEFSPDGRFLATVRGYGTDLVIEQKLDHGGPRDLMLFPVDGGDPVNLTEHWDLMAGTPVWSREGDSLYFTAQQGGTSHLFRVPSSGGAVEQVTHGQRRLRGVSFDRDRTRIAYLSGTLEAPAEIFMQPLDGSDEIQLTRVHENFLMEVSPSPSLRLLYESADGTPIEGWLTFPYDFRPDAGPYPLIVHSHGGPHSAVGYSFNFKHQYFAANGYFVLTTNFRGSTGYGEDFKWATWGAWGDLDGADVIAGLDHVLEHFPIDPARVGATGHSYGGFMTNWLIVQYPDRFAAAIPGAGISNWVSDYGTADIARTKETEFFGTPWQEEARRRLLRQSPLIYADRARAATLFVHGELDQRVPYEEAEQMYFALKKNGVEAQMLIYEGQAHGIRGHWNAVHRALNERLWFDKHLKGAAVAGR